MNEKKSLNFDFLDDDSKNDNDKITVPVDTSANVHNTSSADFYSYFKEAFTNFSKFTKEHLMIANPKYLIVAIWIFGMGNAIDRITSSDSSSWGEVWAIVIFGGILSGALVYYIGGWFYHVRIEWSKGKCTIDTARNIYIFSSLPIAVVAIGSLIFNQMAYGSDYFNTYHTDASSVDVIFGLLSLFAIAYSIYISYKAVKDVTHAEKGRSIWWFVVAPTIVYILIVASGILK
jgi:hypothetical protein